MRRDRSGYIVIAWRKSAFMKIDEHRPNLFDLCKDYPSLQKPGLAHLILLEEIRTKARLVVANCHFSRDADAVTFAQAFFLEREVREFLEKHNEQELPVIICGDFNAKPDSMTLKALHDEEIEPT